jgi:uncharacterized delta-60 repeat protein
VARLNPDGSLDTGFDPNADSLVYELLPQSDGKVLMAGYFHSLQPNGAASPTTRYCIARVNADGSLDTGFDPNPNLFVLSMTLQADGKVVFGGEFDTVQPNGAPAPIPRRGLARVNADGTLDSAFDPSPDLAVNSIALLADGSMVLGGGFTYLQPNGGPVQLRSYLARIYADGTLDTAFDPKANDIVRSVTVQEDGHILVCGEFSTLQGHGAPMPTTRNYFAELEGYPTGQSISTVDLPRFFYEVLWHRTGATPELKWATFQFSQDNGATFGQPIVASRVGATADWSISLHGPQPASGVWRVRGYTCDGQHNGSSSVVEFSAPFGTLDNRKPIPGLFNTGVDSAGTPLVHEQLDPHYNVIPAPLLQPPTVITSVGGFPIPPWVDYANPVSEWITPSGPLGADPGDYEYQISFDLTGLDPATATITGRWATDNAGTDILVNDQSTGQTSPGFSAFTPFQIPSSFFHAGFNTLTFKVNNAPGAGPNPSGLRVEMSGLAAPEKMMLKFINQTGNYITLNWNSQPNRVYRMQSSLSLSGQDWSNMPGDVLATNEVSSKTIYIGDAPSGFYRVEMLP